MSTTLNAAIDSIFAGLACDVMHKHIERLDRIGAEMSKLTLRDAEDEYLHPPEFDVETAECDECWGYGYLDRDGDVDCHVCHGTGEVEYTAAMKKQDDDEAYAERMEDRDDN